MKSDYYSMKSDYTMEDTIMKQSIRLRQDTDRFNSLYKEMDDIYHDIAFSLGLSDSAFVILYFISILGDGCLQKDICEVAYISKQTINSSIKRLQQQEIIHLSAGKRRDMHIHLTPLGQKLVSEKILPVLAMENRVFETFTPQESQLLISLTEKYIKNLAIEANVLLQKKEG